jgi:peptide-methionine (S)-S-oxide reductase
MWILKRPTTLPSPDDALPGRTTPIAAPGRHFVSGRPLTGPWPAGIETAIFGLGCFWGAERRFWETPGVYSTAVGYAGGYTPNPTYEEVCTGKTGQPEVVLVAFDPGVVSYPQLLSVFWENHDPTQGMRQGNDVGTQYRSAIYVAHEEQRRQAEASRALYQERAGYGTITTELLAAGPFYNAEGYHQQYLARNPNRTCADTGTGVACPIGVNVVLPGTKE